MEEETVVGFEDEVLEIIHQLQDMTIPDLDIVSIVGMAGQGKTALAKAIYNHRSVNTGFNIRAWCCVSQEYHERQVLLDLLTDILIHEENRSGHGIQDLDETQLREVLFKTLYERRYLIVLDDIWDNNVWKDLRYCFPNNRNGSRILLTSRIRSVALQAKPSNEPLVLRPLSDFKSLQLLKKKLFGNQDFPTEQIQNVLSQIAKNCKGLPLAILYCSGALAKMEQERWEDFVASLKTIMSSSRILELSYEALPDHLKPCLLYLGSVLPNQEILVSRLIWLWIAEGLVQQPNKGEQEMNIRLEDLGMDYLIDLIDRSLVMVEKKGSSGGTKSIRVHESIHQFCVQRSKEENFLQVQNLEQELDPSLKSDRLCIQSWRNLPQNYDHNLSSIIYIGKNGHGGLPLLSEFSYTKLLRVLNLMGYTCTYFPSQVEKLVQLRYLALSGQITSVPSTIVKLENLETFLLKGLLAEISLPYTLLKLRKLKHMQVKNHVVFSLPEKNLDQECPESSNIETFSTLLLSSRQVFLEDIIKKMSHIRKLKCTFLRSRYCGEGYQIPALDFLIQLESLNLHSLAKVGYDLAFKFPSNLKKLTLSNFRLPWKIMTRSISALKNLEVLKLLNKACEGESWDLETDQQEEKFPNLKFLKLENLDIVRFNASSENFPCLQELVLNGCSKLEDVSNDLAEVNGLKTIHVMKHCNESVAKWARNAEEIGVKVFMDTN